jgi:hypothetical protein
VSAQENLNRVPWGEIEQSKDQERDDEKQHTQRQQAADQEERDLSGTHASSGYAPLGDSCSVLIWPGRPDCGNGLNANQVSHVHEVTIGEFTSALGI